MAAKLPMVTRDTALGGAPGRRRRVVLAHGGGVGGALVAAARAVHAGAEGGARVAVRDGRVRDPRRRHLLDGGRRLRAPAHPAHVSVVSRHQRVREGARARAARPVEDEAPTPSVRLLAQHRSAARLTQGAAPSVDRPAIARRRRENRGLRAIDALRPEAERLQEQTARGLWGRGVLLLRGRRPRVPALASPRVAASRPCVRGGEFPGLRLKAPTRALGSDWVHGQRQPVRPTPPKVIFVEPQLQDRRDVPDETQSLSVLWLRRQGPRNAPPLRPEARRAPPAGAPAALPRRRRDTLAGPGAAATRPGEAVAGPDGDGGMVIPSRNPSGGPCAPSGESLLLLLALAPRPLASSLAEIRLRLLLSQGVAASLFAPPPAGSERSVPMGERPPFPLGVFGPHVGAARAFEAEAVQGLVRPRRVEADAAQLQLLQVAPLHPGELVGGPADPGEEPLLVPESWGAMAGRGALQDLGGLRGPGLFLL